MNVHTYWRALSRDHQQAMSTSTGPAPIDRLQSLLVVAASALATLILMAAGGYRVGFDVVYGLGRFAPTALVETFSKFGETLAAISLIALFAKRQPRALWMAALASVYAALLTYLIKRLSHTARPPALLGDWVGVGDHVLRLYGFPSGHTVTAFVLAACLSVGAPRGIRLVLFSLAAAVGASRVVIGAHWPIDVIAGAGVAGLSVGMAMTTMRFTRWGLGMAPHLFLVSMVALSAVLELVTGPQDSLARLLRVAVASVSVALLARDYVYHPWLSGLRCRAGKPG
ncbi:MAG: phosphatase PAP2 family protein [Steroidobacteraceae bacterium]